MSSWVVSSTVSVFDHIRCSDVFKRVFRKISIIFKAKASYIDSVIGRDIHDETRSRSCFSKIELLMGGMTRSIMIILCLNNDYCSTYRAIGFERSSLIL